MAATLETKLSVEVSELLKKAKGSFFSNGDAKAQYLLGIRFEYGRGVPKDERQAQEWYSKAAENGHAGAKCRKAAENGHADAQFKLGVRLANGLGILRDDWQAVKWYQKAAEQGHSSAQFELGYMLEEGLGVPKDERKAEEWYRMARKQKYATIAGKFRREYEEAEQGRVEAQFNIALMLQTGRGVAKDERQAFMWYRKAASSGDVDAQNNLAGMYLNGKGVAKDFEKAHQWFLKATLQNEPFAHHALGTMYEAGLGVIKDAKKALDYYQKATKLGLDYKEYVESSVQDAENGYEVAYLELHFMAKRGISIAQEALKTLDPEILKRVLSSLTTGPSSPSVPISTLAIMPDAAVSRSSHLPEGGERLEKQQEVRELFKRAENGIFFSGNAEAQFKLGWKFENGEGIAEDKWQAEEWYRKAAEQGHTKALFCLGWTWKIKRHEISKDEIDWYRKAAAEGNSDRQLILACMIDNGKCVSCDLREAVEWYRKAANRGNSAAKYYLGVMFEQGRGVSKDERQAVKWYRDSAQWGFGPAQFNLARMLEQGRGGLRDAVQAIEWYRKADKDGRPGAREALERLQSSLPADPSSSSVPDPSPLAKVPSSAAFSSTTSAEAEREMARKLKEQEALLIRQREEFEARKKAQGALLKEQAAEIARKQAQLLEEERKKQQEMSAEVQELLRKAKAGEAWAQYNLGVMYENGRGVAKDERQAMEWYHKAAEQGNAKAKSAFEDMLARAVSQTDVKITLPSFLLEPPSEIPFVIEEQKASKEIIQLQKAVEAGDVQALYMLGKSFIKGLYGVSIDVARGVMCLKRAADQGHITAQFNIGVAFEQGHGVAKDERQAVEWYSKAAAQGHAAAKRELERLQATSLPSATVYPLASPLREEPDALERKEKHETKLTQEQREVLDALGKAGLNARDLEQLNKDLCLLSAQECRAFSDWRASVNSHLSRLQQELSKTHQELDVGPETKARCEFIKIHPKLLAYQRRLEKEFGYFALCYSLAPAGLLQLEDNKKDMMISAMTSIPQATIEGIPLAGPLLGKVFSQIPKGLKFANKKHRMQQANQIKELFGGLREIIKIAYLLSLELTLAKQTEIEAHEKTQYQGFARIKGLYKLGKAEVMKLWRDLISSDTAGVKLAPTEELAILDSAFIMQQVSAEEVHIDSSKDIIPQLVEVVIGKPYKPIVLALPPADEAPITPIPLLASPLAPVSPVVSPLSPTPLSPAPLSVEETLKRLQEAERKAEAANADAAAARADAAAARAETKSLAEKIARSQEGRSTEVDGGAQALLFERSEVPATTSVSVSYAEFHALRQQVTLTSQKAEQTDQRVDAMSLTVYDLQDGKKTDRSKAGATRQMTHALDRTEETKRKLKEEKVREEEKVRAQRGLFDF